MFTINKTLIATSIAAILGSTSALAHTPIDLAIADQDQLANMLVRKGQLSADASPQQREAAVQAYIERKLNHGLQGDAQFGKKALIERAKVLKSIEANKGPQKQRLLAFEVATKRTDKVLALLVDFPDLHWDNNRLTSEHTQMLYDNYDHDHYQSLLFSDTGYTGPNGENFISMRQYYESESGNTYSVSGEAKGWYRTSKNASYYGGNSPTTDGDKNAQELIREALAQLAQDPSINLADYDIEDRYDYDGDGNYREPDGVIDHLMIFHASVGEEAGGGVLGDDAIWSHRFNLGKPYVLAGTSSGIADRFNGQYAAYDYTIQPIDAAAGVCAHEYGHDLGLPDEYDTKYTGKGEPVSYWSIMSSGSWAGKIGGTQPTAFSSWSKSFLQEAIGGNWVNNQQFSLADLTKEAQTVKLYQTTDNGKPNQVRIDLPKKHIPAIKPFEGDTQFYSDRGNNLRNSMASNVQIPDASKVTLSFKVWYSIEEGYDFARILVNGKPIAGNITTNNDPYKTGLVPALTGDSNGWVNAEFDLTAYAGQEITLGFDYLTDGGVAKEGVYIDNLTILADGSQVAVAKGESDDTLAFNMKGYALNQGFHEADHYYLLQWRSHNDIDAGLANIKRMGQMMSFEPGLVVWYVDKSLTNNWVGKHPGEGWLGVVDADQQALKWANTGTPAQTRYQVRDAAFSNQDQAPLRLVSANGDVLEDSSLIANAQFKDEDDYTSPEIPDSGRKLTPFGLEIDVIEQAANNSYGVVRLSVKEEPNVAPVATFKAATEALTLTTTNTSSDEDGNIVSYAWDFGNGASSNEAAPTYTYDKAGSYTVTLTVTDDRGATATQSQIIEVIEPNKLPQVSAKYIHLGRLTTLWSTSEDEDGRIVDTEWHLPNGKVKRGKVIMHLFPSYGNHDVTLRVMDNDGAIVTKTIKVDL
ncbi:protease [Photobacterium jeanii]|uniref:Protease n=1 Tax=Photobacterium jeanii TaxID=858640 RepID=A0A178K7P0_9GAMM|nr:immune inhibitor A domain-containing protein [Photobacterium jeanii]OAN13086.1 protease [Photobacterium jeanii]PST89236.1 M6 family metalloprotease domain-containing protein [Photobacterium jeanii]